MPIITEPKKLSMPQQVQKNKEDIESIFKIIDGLDATDNVVVVPDMSYILSADELKSVRQPVAFIVYDNQLFIKKKEENGNAYFNLVFSIAVSTVVSFESKQIEVNLTNGALGITLATVNTYSASQIDNKFATIIYVDNALASKASLSGANFTGGITAPSIIENMVGYTFDASVASSNVSLSFVGAVKNGNKLTLVIAGKVRKSDGFTTTLGQFEIPQDIADKIYYVQDAYVANMSVMLTTNILSSGIQKVGGITKLTGRFLRAVLVGLTDLVEDTDYMFRMEQTFLLSDNLAQ